MTAKPSPDPTVENKNPIQRNIDTIRSIEEEALRKRTYSTIFGDWVAQKSGSMGFVWFNAIWYGAWILLNMKIIPGMKPFDPFPFTFLTLCVSLEAIFLSVFVLMSQNNMARQSDLRTHLDLQINLLAEAENTRMLQILVKISEKLQVDIEDKQELDLLKSPTPIKSLLEKLKNDLPEEF